jgi:hypothetical protein
MKVFLVEIKDHDQRMEPVGILTSPTKVVKLMKDHSGIVTEMETNEIYLDGIGICNHWHIDPESEDLEQFCMTYNI